MREEPARALGLPAMSREGVAERALSHVAEGGVPEVMPEGDGLGQVLVQSERPRDRAGNLGDLQGVDEAGAVVIALRGEKHLRLVGEPPEALGVQDAVAIALEARPEGVRLLGNAPSERVARERRVRGKPLALGEL